jgi:thioredoxin 1
VFLRFGCGPRLAVSDAGYSPAVGVSEVTDASFEQEVVQADRPVDVDFWAPWCGPCRVVNPIIEDLASQHGDRVKFLKLNVDDNPGTSARYNVLSIPTVILFEGGEARETVIGARSKSHYESAWAHWLQTAA